MSKTVHDPNQRYTLTLSKRGDTAIIDCEVEPGGGVPAHKHPNQEEKFTILEGEFEFRNGRERVKVAPGDELTVPAGATHWFKNIGEQTGRHRAELTPALNAEGFFVESARLAQDVTRSRLPKSFKGAVRAAHFIDRYKDDVELSFPPRFMLAPLLLFADPKSS